MNTPTPNLHYMNTFAVAQRREINIETGEIVSWFGHRMAVGCHKFNDTFILFPIQSRPPPAPLQSLAISNIGLGTLAVHGPGRLRHGMLPWNSLTLTSKDPSYVVLIPVSGTSKFLGWAVNQNLQPTQSYAVSRTIPEMMIPQRTVAIIRETFCRMVCPCLPRLLPSPTNAATTALISAPATQSITRSNMLDNNRILNATTTPLSPMSSTICTTAPVNTSSSMTCPQGSAPYRPSHHPMHIPLSKCKLTTITSPSTIVDNFAEKGIIEDWDLYSKRQSFRADDNGPEITDEHDCSGEAFSKAFEYASNRRSACDMVRHTLMVITSLPSLI